MVGKDEFSLRNIEALLHPLPPAPAEDAVALKKARSPETLAKGGVLVVGVDSLMTQLAKCCKPAPPDAIRGFVTRGRGVSVHRADCANFREMAAKSGERVIAVAWGERRSDLTAVYPIDVLVEAADRQGLVRDISDLFAKERMNVIGVQTRASRGAAWMLFTVETGDTARLVKVLSLVAEIKGVRAARRR
jgi:GTP pyrophosphokinase